jgi:hypothetical protein
MLQTNKLDVRFYDFSPLIFFDSNDAKLLSYSVEGLLLLALRHSTPTSSKVK